MKNTKLETESQEPKVECHWEGSVFYVRPKIFFEVLFQQNRGHMKYVRAETGALMFDVCKNNFLSIAKEAEAMHKHNGTTLIDVEAVSRYINSLEA